MIGSTGGSTFVARRSHGRRTKTFSSSRQGPRTPSSIPTLGAAPRRLQCVSWTWDLAVMVTPVSLTMTSDCSTTVPTTTTDLCRRTSPTQFLKVACVFVHVRARTHTRTHIYIRAHARTNEHVHTHARTGTGTGTSGINFHTNTGCMGQYAADMGA